MHGLTRMLPNRPPTSLDINAYKDTGAVEVSPGQINVGASFWQDGAVLKGFFEYSTDLFDVDTIRHLARWFDELLAALLAGAGAFEAVGPGWQAVIPEVDTSAAYERALIAIASLAAPPLPDGLLDVALAAANACLLAWERFGRHLANAKKLGVTDAALAEALSVTVLPAGNPVFVRACALWRDMVESGRLAASPELRHAFRQIGSAASPKGQGA